MKKLPQLVYFHVAYKHWLLTEHGLGHCVNSWIQIWVIFDDRGGVESWWDAKKHTRAWNDFDAAGWI